MCHKTQLEQDCGKQKGQDYRWALWFKPVGPGQVLVGGIYSSPIGPSDIMKKDNAFPIGCILPGGFGPVLGIAWMKKAGQVVPNTQAICATDPLPDL